MSVSLRVSCVYPYAALLSLCLRGRTCHGRCERPQRPTLGPNAPSRRPPRIQSSRMTRLGLQTDTSAVRNRLRHRRRPQCWAEPCGGRLDQICFWPHAQVRILFLPDLNAKIKLVCLLATTPRHEPRSGDSVPRPQCWAEPFGGRLDRIMFLAACTGAETFCAGSERRR